MRKWGLLAAVVALVHVPSTPSAHAQAGGRAQAPVPVSQEPHHKVRLDTIRFRILEVTIAPGDTTLDHRHDFDIATVALNDATTRTRTPGEDWGGPRVRTLSSPSVTQYADKPGAHRVENIGKTPYHLIAVENVRTSGWSTEKPLTAPATKVIQDTRAFAIYDVTLGGATRTTAHTHALPAVGVVLSGTVENGGSSGEEPARFQAGEWVVIPTGNHVLKAAGTGDAHIVEVEVR